MDNRIEISNIEKLKSDIDDIMSLISNILVDHKKWFAKIYLQEVLQKNYYVIGDAKGVLQYIEYLPSNQLSDEATLIILWLENLKERSPDTYQGLSNFSFTEALEEASDWYESMGEDVPLIPGDPIPIKEGESILDLGDGWKIHNLENPRSILMQETSLDIKIDRSFIINDNCYIFSLMHDSLPYGVVVIDKLDIVHLCAKSGSPISKKYWHLIDKAFIDLCPRIILNRPLDETITTDIQGWFQVEDNIKVHIEEGVIHNGNDEPAVIYPDGKKAWFNEGLRHRDSNPAIVGKNGNYAWYYKGRLHREDGPALQEDNGDKTWYKHGRIHRDDGGPCVTFADGTTLYYYNDRLHRDENKPAVISVNGVVEWWCKGQRHREDGPAVIKANGEQRWYRYGVLHRENGPAIVRINGDNEFWIDGIRVKNV